MISYYGGEYLVNFERYAQVLSQNFNVRIYLDGTRAETHEDNSIHLPNIKNMSEKELDCLYGILLHEIGHVKFSHLSNLEVKKMKGRDHFSIWNGVEDARIENKLMARLDGANNIFERLYGIQFTGLAKKIFGIDFSDDTDQWHLFCVHVHDYLLKTKHKHYNIDSYSPSVKEAVLEVFAKAKPIIDAHKLSRAEHSFSLATKLFKAFGPKRLDLVNEFKGVVSDLDKCRKELQDIYDSFKNNEKLKQLKAQKKELEAKRKKIQKDAEKNDNFKKHREAERSLEYATSMIEHIQFFKETETLEKEIAGIKGQIELLETKLEKEHAELKTLMDAMDAMKKDKKAEGFDATALAQKKEETKRRKSLIRDLSKELALLRRTLASKEKKLQEQKKATSYYNSLKTDNPFADLSMEELDAKHAEALKNYSETNDANNEVIREANKVKNDVKQLKEEIKRINTENRIKYKEALKKIQKRLGKNGLEAPESMPHFEKNSDWEDSDKVQQEFDKQATAESDKLVNNGFSGGSGERSILMTVDKLDNELEEIDLAKVFKEKLGLDELKNYNDYLSEIRNTSQDEDTDVKAVDKNYFPVTTQFDVNRAELAPNNIDVLVDIRNKNIKVINELAAIFKVKMRNVKHIKFRGNQEDGIIDARSVYKIPNNIDDHIFERAFVKPNDRVIVSVALDLSGSMDKDFTAGGKRLLEMAVILDAALTKAMIKHEVVGYGAPADRDVAALNANEALYTRTQHRLETITYRTFAGANGLGNIEVKCWDNADGESLRSIAYRLLKARSKMKVIINISDGKPFLHGADAGILDNDLKKTLSWLSANKIQLYPLGFNDYPKNLFGHDYMKIDDYSQLPKFFRESK